MSWTECLVSPAACGVGVVAGQAAESTWESFTGWVGRGVSGLAADVFDLFSRSTLPTVDAPWFRANIDTIAIICLPVLVAFFVLQVLTGVVRREPGHLVRAVVGVVIATGGLPIALALVDRLSRFVDATAAHIVGTQTADGFARLVDIGAVLSVGTGGGVVLIATLVTILSMLALYVVLLLRQVALLAVVVFVPLALLGWTWESTRGWLRRWAELTAALILSKLVMAVVFALGLSAIGGAGDSRSDAANLGNLLAGTVLVALAAFTPWVTFHFLHFTGNEAATSLQMMTRQGAGSAKAQTVDRGRNAVHQAVRQSALLHAAHPVAAATVASRTHNSAGAPPPASRPGHAHQHASAPAPNGHSAAFRYPDPRPHRPGRPRPDDGVIRRSPREPKGPAA
jgi:hypothetical protein